jgi:hypothetical protein
MSNVDHTAEYTLFQNWFLMGRPKTVAEVKAMTQKHQEEGRYKDAAHHALLAQAHKHYADVYSTEASKSYLDAHPITKAAG